MTTENKTLQDVIKQSLDIYNEFLIQQEKKRFDKLHNIFRTILIQSGYPRSIGVECFSCGCFDLVGFDGNILDYDIYLTMWQNGSDYEKALISIYDFLFEINDSGINQPRYMSFDYIGDDKEMFEKSLISPYDNNGNLRG